MYFYAVLLIGDPANRTQNDGWYLMVGDGITFATPGPTFAAWAGENDWAKEINLTATPAIGKDLRITKTSNGKLGFKYVGLFGCILDPNFTWGFTGLPANVALGTTQTFTLPSSFTTAEGPQPCVKNMELKYGNFNTPLPDYMTFDADKGELTVSPSASVTVFDPIQLWAQYTIGATVPLALSDQRVTQQI